MKDASSRFLAVAALLLGAAVTGVAGAKALPCADYITTAFGDAPDAGFLVGTSTRTNETRADGDILFVKGGATEVETWEVGYYEMSNGSRIRIDCRDYSHDV
jgi:hypothetical protein